jgi:hypothetical protein
LNGPRFTRPVILLAATSSGIATGTVAKTFFIIFVDAIFTTLVERLFTNASHLIDARSASDCLCHARHAD